MPFAGLLEAIMAGKFESRFKYRDEGDVNARTSTRRTRLREVLLPQALLRFVRFGLPFRFSHDDNHRARRRSVLRALAAAVHRVVIPRAGGESGIPETVIVSGEAAACWIVRSRLR